MQRLLKIYKFNIPFIDEEFERIKYDSILEDLEKLFLYEEEFENIKIISKNNFTTTIFNLKNYKAEIIIYTSKELLSTEGFNPLNKLENNYFIPKLQFNFYTKKNINNKILKNIFEIFISTGSNNYIFDYNENIFNFNNSIKILTLATLKKSIEKYNYNYLKIFLENTNTEYIGEKLMNNSILRNSFYYIIYLCFNFYKNLLKIENGKKQIENIFKKNNLRENNSILKLSEIRLNIIEKNLLINFINYKKILDILFNLLRKF